MDTDNSGRGTKDDVNGNDKNVRTVFIRALSVFIRGLKRFL
jgi:hypothetical protein